MWHESGIRLEPARHAAPASAVQTQPIQVERKVLAGAID